MKFSCTVIVNKPQQRVVNLFSDPNHLNKWQDGYRGMKHISGEPGITGAKTLLRYDIGKRVMELTETIIKNELPDSFVANYAANQMVNDMTTKFVSLSPDKTRCEMHIEYTKFNGIMPKLMATLFPGMFKKQTQKWLDQFKLFAERHSPDVFQGILTNVK